MCQKVRKYFFKKTENKQKSHPTRTDLVAFFKKRKSHLNTIPSAPASQDSADDEAGGSGGQPA